MSLYVLLCCNKNVECHRVKLLHYKLMRVHNSISVIITEVVQPDGYRVMVYCNGMIFIEYIIYTLTKDGTAVGHKRRRRAFPTA